MAASITEVIGLDTDYLGAIPLVSVFQLNGIEVNYNRDTAVTSKVFFSIDTYVFECINVGAVDSTTDKFRLSVDFLKYLIALPTDQVTTADLTKTISYKLTGHGYNALGSSINTVATTPKALKLCFSTPVLGGILGTRSIYTQGSTYKIYHNGRYMYFDYVTKDGYLIVSNSTTTNIGIQYIAPVGTNEVAWLNLDGCFSFWNFKIETEEWDVKNTNEITNFYLKNYEAVNPTETITQSVSNIISLSTVAFNTEHHTQLCQIIRSKRVFIGKYAYNVKDCTKTTGGERQNLSFKLKLEREENAATY